jgi:hypothetical protein
MSKTYRLVKGSPLTHAEMDTNIQELDDLKMDKSAFGSNNSVVARDNSGDLVAVVMTASTILGRKSTGEIVALDKNDIKTILNLGIDDVDGLQDVLDVLAGSHTHPISEVTGLSTALAGKASSLALGNWSIVNIGVVNLLNSKAIISFVGQQSTDRVMATLQHSPLGLAPPPFMVRWVGDEWWVQSGEDLMGDDHRVFYQVWRANPET